MDLVNEPVKNLVVFRQTINVVSNFYLYLYSYPFALESPRKEVEGLILSIPPRERQDSPGK